MHYAFSNSEVLAPVAPKEERPRSREACVHRRLACTW